MRFHHGLAVGHLPCLDGELTVQRTVDPGSPMQVDTSNDGPSLDLLGESGHFTEDEGSIASSVGESDGSSLYDTEPDSEAEPDIYD